MVNTRPCPGWAFPAAPALSLHVVRLTSVLLWWSASNWPKDVSTVHAYSKPGSQGAFMDTCARYQNPREMSFFSLPYFPSRSSTVHKHRPFCNDDQNPVEGIPGGEWLAYLSSLGSQNPATANLRLSCLNMDWWFLRSAWDQLSSSPYSQLLFIGTTLIARMLSHFI